MFTCARDGTRLAVQCCGTGHLPAFEAPDGYRQVVLDSRQGWSRSLPVGACGNADEGRADETSVLRGGAGIPCTRSQWAAYANQPFLTFRREAEGP